MVGLLIVVIMIINAWWCGMWWRIGWDDDFQPEGRGFDSYSNRHVETLGKSFTCSCLFASAWNSDTVSVCCSREHLWVVEDLKGHNRNGRNEWMNEWIINQPGTSP